MFPPLVIIPAPRTYKPVDAKTVVKGSVKRANDEYTVYVPLTIDTA